MDWLSPPITFSRTKLERLLNPPLQKSQESCGANTAPRRFVAAKTGTARPPPPPFEYEPRIGPPNG